MWCFGSALVVFDREMEEVDLYGDELCEGRVFDRAILTFGTLYEMSAIVVQRLRQGYVEDMLVVRS
jgi:hypothetical protein